MFRDNRNRLLTTGLFAETAQQGGPFVKYDMAALKETFMELEDPTWYAFATKFLESYAHYKECRASADIAKYWDAWDEELEVRLKSKNLKRIDGLATGGHYQAMKFLTEGGWKDTPKGRPSNDELAKEKRVAERVRDEYQADVVRLDDRRVK